MKNEGIDSNIVGKVGLLRADDSAGNLEDLVLDVVEDQFFVLAFRDFAVKVLLKLFFVRTHGAGRQIKEFA